MFWPEDSSRASPRKSSSGCLSTMVAAAVRDDKAVAMTDDPSTAIGRRHLFEISLSAAGAFTLSSCARPSPPAKPPQEVPVTPPEDLMREHGVLKRVLLIYREGIRRLQSDVEIPVQEFHASAGIIRSFIEDYHEHLEEQYVFPALEKAGKLRETTAVLREQHQRGREVTDRVLTATASSHPFDQPGRESLTRDLAAFVRMYEPHEAREDTVIFPALREVLPASQFGDLAETFEDEEHRRFGPAGFEGIVDRVAEIEKALEIYDLSQFTPS